jgi:hypothetical protein
MFSRYILAVLSRSIPLGTALTVLLLKPDPFYKVATYSIGIVFLFATEYYSIYRPIKSLNDVRTKLLDGFLKQWLDGAEINGKKPKLRLNVMLKCRPPEHFFLESFVQFYQLNMQGWPDANLSYLITKGFSGKIFKNRHQETYYVDLRQLDPREIEKDYRWTRREANDTRHVKAIACVPLIRSGKSIIGAPKEIGIGVLNIDATDDLGAVFLAQQETLERITTLGKIVQSAFDV